ncbi:MAG TPA: methyl-accepting chemotaxis protein [Candidatus Cybelea sp.]|nr:methyl-accepting chemotaxis protein [Candidatus Cybelea sp.]
MFSRFSGFRIGIKVRLFLAFGALSAMTAIACMVAWLAFGRVDTTLDELAGRSMPEISLSLDLARQSAEIAALAPELATVANEADRQRLSDGLRQKLDELRKSIKLLQARTNRDLPAVTSAGENIGAKLDLLDSAVRQRLAAQAAGRQLAADLATARDRFMKIVAPLIDDASFNLTLGLTSFNDKSDIGQVTHKLQELSNGELALQQALQQLVAQVNLSVGLLQEVGGVTELAMLQPIGDKLVATAGSVRKSLDTINKIKKNPELTKSVEDMLAYGLGSDNMVAKRSDVLKASSAAAELLKINRDLAAGLGAEVSKAVEEARTRGESAASASNAAIARGRRILMILLAASLIAAGLITWLYGDRSLVRQLTQLGDVMRKLAAGDKGVTIVALKNTDEIGDMARAVEVFKQNALENERLQDERRRAEAETRKREEAQRQAEDQRRAEEARREREALEAKREEEQRRHHENEQHERAASEQRRQERSQLAESFEATVKGVVDTVSAAAGDMQSTASSMAATAEETSRQSAAVAAASAQATTNAHSVAVATKELSTSVSEIGRQVAQSTRIAEKAVEEAMRTNTTVKGLAEAAQRIGQVVEMINSIAGQTNLLALNATIEAARAGEAGKGFAVVASEVKSLANQTAKATEEIGAQISGMQKVTGETVKAIEAIGATIREISQIASSIATAVEQQGAATQEIARNVAQTAAGTQEVSSNISSVTQAAGETGEAANLVLRSAGDLAKQSDLLRAEVDKFVRQIRAA